MSTRDEDVLAELERLREDAEKKAAERAERLFTYDVTFSGDSELPPLTQRCEAHSPSGAITVAADLVGVVKLMGRDRTVTVNIPDLEGEAKHAEEYAPLYLEEQDAVHIFEYAGFKRAPGTPWFKHDETGLAACIDPPEGPIGQRFAGVYMHRVDEETGKDQMFAWALIPWYGDGAWHDRAKELLQAALQTATQE